MQQYVVVPFAWGMAFPQSRVDVIGFALPVHVYPVATPGQPVTDGSGMQGEAGAIAVQQNARVIMSASSIPCPHVSVASVCGGVEAPTHE